MYKQITFMLVGSLILLSQIGIATIVPNAMAIADYDNTDQYMKYAQDMTNKNYYKSHSSDLLQKIKCNNINANLNNIDANFGSSAPVNGDTTDGNGEAVAAQGENGWTNDDRNFVNRENNFSVVCVNNNNNTAIGEGEEPISKICEECFAVNSTVQTALENFLIQNPGFFTFTAFDAGLVIGPGTDTIEQLCKQLELSAELFGVPATDLLLKFFLSFPLGVDFETPQPGIDAVVECLLEAGIIVHDDTPIPPSDSISATGLDNMNIQCTGSPLCSKIEQQ